jgi:hypothetical protein
MLKTYKTHNEFTQPFIQPRSCKRLLDRDDLNYLEAILHAELGMSSNKLQEKLCTAKIIKHQSQHFPTHSAVLPSYLQELKYEMGTKQMT